MVKDLAGLSAAAASMVEVFPAVDPWPHRASAARQDAWMQRAELVATLTGMCQVVLAGGALERAALAEAEDLLSRFEAVGQPSQLSALRAVVDHLQR